jgi:DNA-binding response OmpR family regulator
MADDKGIHILYLARGRQLAQDHEQRLAVQHVVESIGFDGLPPIEWQWVTNQKVALRLGRPRPPRIVMVELKEGSSRLEFCNQVRTRWNGTKLVAVTNLPTPANHVFDGILSLPLNPDAVRALLIDILGAPASHLLQRGPIGINLGSRIVTTAKGQYHMTPKQCALLHLLMMRKGEVVSRREIMQSIWETTYLKDTRTLDVHIRWLRECIETEPSAPRYLITVRGRGYRLVLE